VLLVVKYGLWAVISVTAQTVLDVSLVPGDPKANPHPLAVSEWEQWEEAARRHRHTKINQFVSIRKLASEI
jgi:hypothetical protein